MGLRNNKLTLIFSGVPRLSGYDCTYHLVGVILNGVGSEDMAREGHRYRLAPPPTLKKRPESGYGSGGWGGST